MAGTQSTATGIGTRPTYDYAPPSGFFKDANPTGGRVFNVADFGAVADPNVDNRPMIQAAIDAAAKAGGGIVYIPPGVYGIAAPNGDEGAIQIRSNVFLKGAGMGETTLRLVDGSSTDITGLVRTQWGVETHNAGVADLTIDGNRANTTGQVDGFFTGPVPGQPISDKDIYLLRVEIEGVSRYGFDPHETTERLWIKNSVAHDNAVDGFVLDRIVGGVFVGNQSFNNGRHGFNVVTTSENLILANNIAHHNGGAGFVVQRGSEDIDAPSRITIRGGSSYANGREGVLLQGAENIVVHGIDIHHNGMSGIRLYGASHVTVLRNRVHDNSQSQHDGYSEIQIQTWSDTVYSRIYAASDNLVQGNSVSALGTIAARYGVEERDADMSGNVFINNAITGTVRGPMALNGDGSFLYLYGSNAANAMVGSSTHDKILGRGGDDAIWGQDGNDWLDGQAGNDRISGGKGDDTLIGGLGNDTLNGNSSNDRLFGQAGNDTLIGEAGDDRLLAGAGNDIVSGGSGNDTIIASAGNDRYDGGSGYDVIDFSSFTAAVSINLNSRSASGAGSGADFVSGFEEVIGSRGNDIIVGDKNANTLSAGAGNDIIRGMGGADILSGGSGSDTFTWDRRDVVDSGVYLGRDTILDFGAGDVLNLRNLLAGSTYGSIDEVVTFADTAGGQVLIVDIAGTDYEIAEIKGASGLTAGDMIAGGMMVV